MMSRVQTNVLFSIIISIIKWIHTFYLCMPQSAVHECSAAHISGDSIDKMVSVTIDIMYRYHSTCINVIYSNTHQGSSEENLFRQKVFKKLGSRFTLFSETLEVFKKGKRSLNCKYFYVFLDKYLQNIKHQNLTEQLSDGVWLLFLEESVQVHDIFNTTLIPHDSQLFLVIMKEELVVIREVYHVHLNHPLVQFDVGNWSRGEGLVWTHLNFHQRRNNLHNAVIKVGYSRQEPLIAEAQGNASNPSGMLPSIWALLQEKMNFTSEFYVPEDRQTGILNHKNGTWSGVLGMLVKKQVDVGINLFSFTHTRMNVVDYFPTLWDMKVQVVVKKPKEEISSLSNILAPFSMPVWHSIMVLMSAAVLILTVVRKIMSKVDKKNVNALHLILRNPAFYIFGIFCNQAQAETPSYWTCRMIFLATRFTVLIIFILYSANFVSYLSLKRFKFPFSGFKGLLKDGRYRLGVVNGSAHEGHFKNSYVEVMQEIYTKLMVGNLPKGYMEGMLRVCSDVRYGFVIPNLMQQGLEGKVPCTITTVPDAHYNKPNTFIITKNNPYKKLFNQYIQDMLRSGIVDRIHRSELPQKYRPKEIIHVPPPSVGLDTVEAFFEILAFGIVVSSVICLVETVYVKFLKRRKPKKIQMRVHYRTNRIAPYGNFYH